jgi:hypothetical protein
MDQLVNGVGCVCMSAAGLEWSLGYLVHAMHGWDDETLAKMMGPPGKVWMEFDKLCTERLQPLGPDVEELRSTVESLRRERNQIVHSVWLLSEAASDSPVVELWHPRSDATRTVVAEDLFDLANRIASAAAEVQGLTMAILERGQHEQDAAAQSLEPGADTD